MNENEEKNLKQKTWEFAKDYTFFPVNILFGGKDPDKGKGVASSLKNTFATVGLVLFANQTIQQSTGLAFEDADEYLSNQGYSQEIIDEYYGKNIKVRPRHIGGLLHTANDAPPIFNLSSMHRLSNSHTAVHGGKLDEFFTRKIDKIINTNITNRFVTLPSKDSSAAEIISDKTGIPLEYSQKLNIDDIQINQAEVLSTLRKADKERSTPTNMPEEVYSITYSYNIVAKEHDNPQLTQIGVYIEVMDANKFGAINSRDSAFNAVSANDYINGKTVSEYTQYDDMQKIENMRWIRDNIIPSDLDIKDDVAKTTQTFRQALEDAADMPDGVQKFIELYIEAAEYLAPDLVNQNNQPNQENRLDV